MTWYAWTIVALCALNTAANILYVGRPREPITPGSALAVCVVNALMIWGVISLSAAAA